MTKGAAWPPSLFTMEQPVAMWSITVWVIRKKGTMEFSTGVGDEYGDVDDAYLYPSPDDAEFDLKDDEEVCEIEIKIKKPVNG